MTVDTNLWAPTGRQPTPAGISVAVGGAVMIAAALLATVFPPAELPGRVLVIALAAGVFAAVVADLRAVAAVTGLGMAIFVGFLANRFGELTGDADAWSYTVLIGFASALGTGYRVIRSTPQSTGEEPDPRLGLRPVNDGSDLVVSPPDTSFGGSRGV
ncbi:hypothetical protein [Micromonospora sp. WMMD737]|uniref:hypothetical protein n=1 Tax=Micromonospora sp. WMMD737 TaxID=3404113 RepID=UPI003B94DD27